MRKGRKKKDKSLFLRLYAASNELRLFIHKEAQNAQRIQILLVPLVPFAAKIDTSLMLK